jgi:hypothetical protein
MTTFKYKSGLPEVPARMRQLPVDERGYPVPMFVNYVNGKPDFRVADADYMRAAVRRRLCWLCGDRLGVYLTFVIGPMCVINRTISEPPSHLECARFAAKACPFLVLPKAKRRDANVPEDAREPAGEMLTRNPGCCCLWTTRSYKLFRAHHGQPGTLFELGEPTGLEWYAEGREATREEVLASVDSGLPLIRPMAEADGPEAVAELGRRYHHFVKELAPVSGETDLDSPTRQGERMKELCE